MPQEGKGRMAEWLVLSLSRSEHTIPGLELAVSKMNEGEIALVTVEPSQVGILWLVCIREGLLMGLFALLRRTAQWAISKDSTVAVVPFPAMLPSNLSFN